MDVKNRSEIEKKNLLMHWFHYYGKMVYTLGEMERYGELLESNLCDVENTAVVSYLNNEGPTVLLLSIRSKKEAELFESVEACLKPFSDKQLEKFGEVKEQFYTEVYKTFMNPEPNVPMSPEEMVTQVVNIKSAKEKTFKK